MSAHDRKEESEMGEPASYGASSEIQAAAETLRSVERLRKRGESLTRARATTLWIWAAAFLAALPVALFIREEVPKEVPALSEGPFRSVIGGTTDEPTVTFLTIGVLALLAGIASIIDYRRQPAHPARSRRRQLSIGEGIVVAVGLIVVGPLFLAALLTVVTSSTAAFAGASVLAVFVGMHIGNRVLSLASVLGLVGVIVARFVSTDDWVAIACAWYVLVFAAGAFGLRRTERALR